jgi:hypothetical protein
MALDDEKKEKIHVNDDKNDLADEQKRSDTSSDEIVYPHGIQLFLIILALSLAVLLVALDQTIIATAIPRITDHFNSVQDIGWYGSVSLPASFKLLLHQYLTLSVGVLPDCNFAAAYLWAGLQDIQRMLHPQHSL